MKAKQVSFRPAQPQDFDYCAKLYFAEMERTVSEPFDRVAKLADFQRRWELTQVQLIILGHSDVGWLQSTFQGNALFLLQLFVEPPFQRHNLGTEVMHRIIKEAAGTGRGVSLGVVKTNPALRLYRRLGFQITHEDERKFYMSRNHGLSSSDSN